MSDSEIFKYLKTHDYEVNAQECLMNVLNTSHQIIKSEYNFDSSMMTIITPENKFVFKWVLGNPQEKSII